METSLAEDVKKPTRTLSPDSFFFMSPYRSFTTSGCFRRFLTARRWRRCAERRVPAADGGRLCRGPGGGDPQAGDGRGYPVRHLSAFRALYPRALGSVLSPGKAAFRPLCRAAGGDGGGGASGDPGAGRVFSHGGTRRRADRHPGSRQSGAIKAYRYYHPRPRRQRRADGATDRPEPRQL